MTVQVTHAYVATGADVGDGEVRKAEWNADHTIVGLKGNFVELVAPTSVTGTSFAITSIPTTHWRIHIVAKGIGIAEANAFSVFLDASDNNGSSYVSNNDSLNYNQCPSGSLFHGSAFLDGANVASTSSYRQYWGPYCSWFTTLGPINAIRLNPGGGYTFNSGTVAIYGVEM